MNVLITQLIFFVPMILFGISLVLFFAIGQINGNPRKQMNAIHCLLYFIMETFTNMFFYGDHSINEKVLEFNITGIMACIMVLLPFFYNFIRFIFKIKKKFIENVKIIQINA